MVCVWDPPSEILNRPMQGLLGPLIHVGQARKHVFNNLMPQSPLCVWKFEHLRKLG